MIHVQEVQLERDITNVLASSLIGASMLKGRDVDRSKSYYANFSMRPAYTPTDDLFRLPGLIQSGGLGGVLRLYDV